MLITRLNCFTGPVPDPLAAERFTAKVPDAVGVPLITPEVVLMLKPAGKPVAVKLVGLFVAVIETLYAEFCVPAGNDVLLITGTAATGFTWSVSGFVPVPTLFVAESITVKDPDAVGVPLITPVVVFTLKPAGSPVAP